jgi:hypothetical protein
MYLEKLRARSWIGSVFRVGPVRSLLRTRLFAWLVGHWISRQLVCLGGGVPPSSCIRILAFSAHRFSQDISVMTSHPRLCVYSFSPRFVEVINALFQEPGIAPKAVYFMEDNPTLLALRRRKQIFIGVIARLISKNVDCAMTPSIQYWSEQDFAAGFAAAGLPFIGLHKEFTVLDEAQIDYRIRIHTQRRQKFQGTELYVTNDLARQLFTQAGVALPEQIRVIGSLRMDRLFAANSPYRLRSRARPQAVLFSFGHLSGGFGGVPRRSHYFSLHDDNGFVELFRAVHAAFAELALELPDVEFAIKLKNNEEWWIREIEAVVHQALNRYIADIPNLFIRSTDAPELIRDAHCVVGFNSTVLLESAILDRNTIVPYFAEATGHMSEYVYLKPYFDVLAIANSKQDLKSKVRIALANPQAFLPSDRERWHQMMQTYLGFDDGKTLERLVNNLEKCVTLNKTMRS